MLDATFFYLFALLTLGGALLTITLRNAVHCAIALITSLIGVAGLFLLEHAEFLFAVQIILYVGGVMVLFIFVIMLVNLDEAAKIRQFNRQWWVAIASALLVTIQLFWFLGKGSAGLNLPPAVAAPAAALGNVEAVADSLFTEYLLPFEVASVLLLAAVVGSVVMAKKRI